VPGAILTPSHFTAAVRVWSAWWALGATTITLVYNYYQMRLYALDANVKFGLVEVLLELAAIAGISPAPAPLPLPHAYRVWFNTQQNSGGERSTLKGVHVGGRGHTLCSLGWRGASAQEEAPSSD